MSLDFASRFSVSSRRAKRADSPVKPVIVRAAVEPLEPRRFLSTDAALGDADGLALTPSIHAVPFTDPRGDILPTYAGVSLPGMDVVAHKVTVEGDRMVFFGRMAGRVEPTGAIGGLYLFGVDRGRGTPRFLGPAAPPVIGPNVRWDSIVRVNPDGTGLFNNALTGVVTPLDRADIKVSGNHFTASVPLSLMLPGATRPPAEWTYNLWPRDGIGRNVQVSDLAPDDGNAPVQVESGGGSPSHGRELQPDANITGGPVVGGGSGHGAAVSDRFWGAADLADDVPGTADVYAPDVLG